jgi:hypothetical protein
MLVSNSCVDLGAAATLHNAMIVMARGDLFTTRLLQRTMFLLPLILALLLPCSYLKCSNGKGTLPNPNRMLSSFVYL